MIKQQTFLAAVLLSSGLLCQTNAQSIGINFGSNRADALLNPTDSAGVIPQENWNNAGAGAGGPLDLIDSQGDPVITSATWAADEEWSIGGPALDANGTLLNGWISANNNDAPDATVTIANIPYALYDLYIYYNHDRGTEDVDISESGGAFPVFRAQENDTDILAEVTFVQQLGTADGDDTQVGNYAKFSALAASTLNLILAPAGAAGSADRGAITGIQIVNVAAGDADGDGLQDAWESAFGLDADDNGENPNNHGVPGNPDNGADGDPDNDGSPNSEEQARGTSPINEDSDGDTLPDGVETNDDNYVDEMATGTDPLSRDSDGDSLEDNVEDNGGIVVDALTMTGTNPNLADTDADGLRDDWEVANMINPFDDGAIDPANGAAGDPDSDNLDNAGEQLAGTNPQDDDSDDDNLLDGAETNDGNYIDANATGTDPLDADSDDDTLTDDVENNTGTFVDLQKTGTNPNLFDTDGDFLRDDWEIAQMLNPNSAGDNALSNGGIGLNLGAGRADAALTGDGLAGVFPQANWNNLSGAVGGPQALTDDTGSGSGASVSWEMDEEWSVAGPGGDSDGVMMTGWFSANNAGSANSIDITSIPYASYDLLLYYNHDRGGAGQTTIIAEANNAFPQVHVRERNPDVLAAPFAFQQQVAGLDEVAGDKGDFILIRDLSAPTLNLRMTSGNSDRGPLTGIQLVNRGAGGFSITDISVSAGTGTVEVTWTSAPGRTYALDSSVDLTEGSWIEVEDSIDSTGTETSKMLSGIDFAAQPKLFFRVRQVPDAL